MSALPTDTIEFRQSVVWSVALIPIHIKLVKLKFNLEQQQLLAPRVAELSLFARFQHRLFGFSGAIKRKLATVAAAEKLLSRFERGEINGETLQKNLLTLSPEFV